MSNYKFDYQVGDLLFFKDGDDFIEKEIEKETGMYHHVAMVLLKPKHDQEDRIIIESQAGRGVHLDFLSEYTKKEFAHFDVKRKKKQLTISQKIELYNNSKAINNQGYDYSGAGNQSKYMIVRFFSKIIGKVIGKEKKRKYCNRVIGYLYDKIGEKVGNNSTPTELAMFNEFEKVFDSEVWHGLRKYFL